MTTELALGGTRLRVPVARLVDTRQKIEEPLWYDVRSEASVEVFRIFVVALEGASSAITADNMNDLC
jgi:hypothetical protein